MTRSTTLSGKLHGSTEYSSQGLFKSRAMVATVAACAALAFHLLVRAHRRWLNVSAFNQTVPDAHQPAAQTRANVAVFKAVWAAKRLAPCGAP